MQSQTLNKKDAAEFLGVTSVHIDTMEAEGTITRLKDFRSPRYSRHRLEQIAGINEKKSYREKALERENAELQERVDELAEKLRQIRNMTA